MSAPGRLAALVVLTGAIGCGGLDADAVRTETEKVESATAEGALVARESARDRVPRNYTWLRSAELFKKVDETSQLLESEPAEAGLESRAREMSELAGDAADLFGELHQAPEDPRVALHVRAKLREISDRADEVAKSL